MSYDDGQQALNDSHGSLLWIYQPIGNVTMNQYRYLVGSDSLLTMLLRE